MKGIVYILLLISHISFAQSRAWETDAAPLHRAQKALTDVIIHDIFSPPVASRIYAYSNMAAYEVLVKSSQQYKSLHQQVKSFPVVPAAIGKISHSLAGVYAFLLTGKSLIFSEAVLQDSIDVILNWYKLKHIGDKEFNVSLAYGKEVAAIMINMAAQDKYKETRSLRRYQYLKQEGKWIPTPPVYMAAVEPNWNRIKPLLLDLV